jgi:hypothetical protein
VLRGGLTVPRAAIQLLWSLEDRGFTLCSEDGRLVVAPRSRLTVDDDRAIRRHRDELLRLIAYAETIQ